MEQKKCALVLPYFGKLHNYFQLFLNSCKKNTDYDWLVFTDDVTEYDYPTNVKRIPFTLEKVKALAEEKIGISVALEAPYKLCDFKPTYGLVFEDYLEGYPYWGHCDCDLLFGDLNGLLTPILNDDYDKIFAAGHLTLYKNTPENNRRFMTEIDGRFIYKEALQTNRIYVFDEDFQQLINPEGKTVHDIFISEKAKIFSEDLSMNVFCMEAKFVRAFYTSEKRTFEVEPYCERRYYWADGKVCSCAWNEEKKEVSMQEYIYIHLQGRRMRANVNTNEAEILELLPDRYAVRDCLPIDKKTMRLWSIRFTYAYWVWWFIKKIKRMLKY